MRQNRGRRADYLVRAEEAEELATLFWEESAREDWLNIAKAYRMLAGIPESADELASDQPDVRPDSGLKPKSNVISRV